MSAPRILLIITGSVAAYKAMDLLRLLQKNSFITTCILTPAACEFITPLLATSLSGRKAHCDLFSPEEEAKIGHIALARNCDLVVVAPASADFLAKMAHGYADDLASTVLLACNKPVLVAPAMNEKMWLSAANQTNLSILKSRGVQFVEPESDILACGEFGIGKIAAAEEIFRQVSEFFSNQNLLSGKKILITGGSTIEPIDPVRFIGNHSSGKQSVALVKNLLAKGAEITFVVGKVDGEILQELRYLSEENHQTESKTNISRIKNLAIISVTTAEEMFLAVKKNLVENDVFIGCAAVCDFFVKNYSKEKIKKNHLKNKSTFTLELEASPDILHFVGHSPKRPKMVIGFAAESENLVANATKKMIEKNCDIIVANNIKDNKIFGSDKTNIVLLSEPKNQLKTRKKSSELLPKTLPVKEILGEVLKANLAEILSKKIVRFLNQNSEKNSKK